MAVSVAEYLGQRTDVDDIDIVPVPLGGDVQCPFRDGKCAKIAIGKQPICSVRKNNNNLWIVCEHRLCATTINKEDNNGEKMPATLVNHQIDILWKVAKTVYRGNFGKSDIVVGREVRIPIKNTSSKSKADFIMRNLAKEAKIDEILLEMQGGGETNSTGKITKHVALWAEEKKDNEYLRKNISGTGTIETNAWRRQQEQFLVKGSVVNQTGGKMVLAISELLYDYLYPRVIKNKFNDLKHDNWTLCLLVIKEDKTELPSPGAIPLTVDQEKTIFTNYIAFVNAIMNQGGPEPSIFKGNFVSLDGKIKSI